MSHYKRISSLSAKLKPGCGGYGCACCNPYGRKNFKRNLNRALRRIQKTKDRKEIACG